MKGSSKEYEQKLSIKGLDENQDGFEGKGMNVKIYDLLHPER